MDGGKSGRPGGEGVSCRFLGVLVSLSFSILGPRGGAQGKFGWFWVGLVKALVLMCVRSLQLLLRTHSPVTSGDFSLPRGGALPKRTSAPLRPGNAVMEGPALFGLPMGPGVMQAVRPITAPPRRHLLASFKSGFAPSRWPATQRRFKTSRTALQITSFSASASHAVRASAPAPAPPWREAATRDGGQDKQASTVSASSSQGIRFLQR